MTKLFSPGWIGGVEIRNRIVLSAMTTRLADAEGHVTEAIIAYYRARARGGVGLITVEMAAPEKAGRHRARELGIYDDRFIPGLKRLVAELHACGARVSIQLGHGGGHTREDICGEPPLAPSAIPHSVYEVTNQIIVPLEMTKKRIEQTTSAFVEAARRAQTAGFDCVELHAAHGYLISQFLCPEENRRTDEYGGSLENRARFGLDILRRTKQEVPGITVIFRLNADDLFPTGMPFSEATQVAQWAAQAGAEAIHVTAGHYRSLPSAEVMIPPMAYPEAMFLDYAARIKPLVNVPIIAVGRLGNPATAMAVVESGKADFVSLGRSLLADPEWVNKAQRGAPLRRCIACNTCVNEMRGGAQLGCLVNPVTGHELEFAKGVFPNGENICVVGAGPAGLSYAELVANDNRVVVIERAQSPGGSFRYAGKAPKFQEVEAREETLSAYVTDLERNCREKGVQFRYGVDVTKDPAVLASFDRLVFATGASYRYGLGAVVPRLLDAGWGRSALMRRLFTLPRLRNWFYYGARRGAGTELTRSEHPAQKVLVIGDAVKAGKAKEAIDSAFRAAFWPPAKG